MPERGKSTTIYGGKSNRDPSDSGAGTTGFQRLINRTFVPYVFHAIFNGASKRTYHTFYLGPMCVQPPLKGKPVHVRVRPWAAQITLLPSSLSCCCWVAEAAGGLWRRTALGLASCRVARPGVSRAGALQSCAASTCSYGGSTTNLGAPLRSACADRTGCSSYRRLGCIR